MYCRLSQYDIAWGGPQVPSQGEEVKQIRTETRPILAVRGYGLDYISCGILATMYVRQPPCSFAALATSALEKQAVKG